MSGLFTREERAVVLFLTVSLLVGSAVMASRRVFPDAVPDFDGRRCRPDEAEWGGAAAQPAPAGPVDVNSAGPDELLRLPGIGPVRAQAIVRLRESRGGFASLDELLDVRGIGPVTLERLRAEAVLGPRPGIPAADTARGRREPL